MSRKQRDYLWIPVFAALVALAVPWFLWGSSWTVAGLPAWLWWHVGWMVVASVAFYAFARDAWERGMGVSHG